MFWFQGFRKIGQSAQRHSYSLSLETALAELFRLYDQAGGAHEAAGQVINAWIEQTAAEATVSGAANGKLAQLLRTRDLHEYVTRDPALAEMKVDLLEQLLFHRSPEARWSAVRPKLLAALPRLCGTADSSRASLELYKRALSDPNSPAGQALVTAALFHFDADAELPPENWSLRFRRGRFPAHDWEPIAGHGAQAPFDWRPANPLCRWEYLAADLTHEVVRAAESGAGQRRPARLRDAGHLGGRKDAPVYSLYCRLERPPGGDAGAAQMSLLPVDPTSFLPEVQRTVHRHLGAEGVRQYALVLRHLARQQPGQVARLDVGALSAGEGDATARQSRDRGRKLLQVLALLCDVELQRVESADSHAGEPGEGPSRQAAVRVSRFLTVLGREGFCAGSHAGGDLNLDDPTQLTLHAAVDSIFWNGDGTTLGDGYRDLPPAVLDCPSREHPLLLGLAAWLPSAWERTWAQAGGVLQRSADRLFDEAGLWLRDADRYRTAEQLKRDLARLQELGVLGQWRVVRGGGRNVLDHEYRLVAPQRARQPAVSLFGIPAEEPAASAPRQVRGWA